METFMYYTGFYGVVTRKEAERYVDTLEQRKQVLRQLQDLHEKPGQQSSSSSN